MRIPQLRFGQLVVVYFACDTVRHNEQVNMFQPVMNKTVELRLWYFYVGIDATMLVFAISVSTCDPRELHTSSILPIDTEKTRTGVLS
jgi:hypothetical protein